MTSRERLQATLNHREPDRLCVDFGAGGQTGMGAAAVSRLRRKVLGDDDWRVKVIEPYQMLGEIDEELRRALGLDVVGISPPTTLFGFRNEGWKPFDLPDGTPEEVYREVRERIDIFAPGGGFVFNAIHNVLSNTPTENLLALFRAVDDARQG